MGTGPCDAAEFSRKPAGYSLRPEQPLARVRGRIEPAGRGDENRSRRPRRSPPKACCCATARRGHSETGLPPQVRGASFISVAFARRSEAIVAYRQRLSTGVEHASGGLLVNDGSGWQVDEQAGAMIGEAVPAAVAGTARRRSGVHDGRRRRRRPRGSTSANRPAPRGKRRRRRCRAWKPAR